MTQVCLAEFLWLGPRRVEVLERHEKASKDMATTHGFVWAQLKKDCAYVYCDQITKILSVFGHRANFG